ncbi:hypothetical protein [Janthinobacterium fluminis]|uniref:DUF1640 domain-containing protein n=1 Tax=Janthinobacterium fluminis TaxID=2987524 RepID=A0ABT5K2A2_9BURK|nr:hypothetical protein [Janthinobacterium fluminis]MDC8759114.1 hypothetical protein [Janthinobacterium fluminis]
MTLQFDTLDYAKRLAETGVPLAQAEAQSTLLAEVLEKSFAHPSDLVALEKNVLSRIDVLACELGGRIDALSCELHGRIDAISYALNERMDKLDAKIDALELKFEARFAAMAGEIHLLKWMVGMSIAMNTGILLKLFLS